MKFYAIQGSPRKKWNDDQLIDRFTEGVQSVIPSAEIEKIYVYDYQFHGCRSCFGCKLLTNKTGECVIRDDIHDLLINIRESDGFIMAAPVYFLDIPGDLHAFLERLMYPGPTDHAAKEERHKTQWPLDLQKAYEAGIRYGEKALLKKAAEENTK